MSYTREATRLFTQTVPTPAAGTEWSLKPTGQGGILVQSLTFRFTASVAVANRVPQLVASDGTNTFWRAQAPANVVAAGQPTYMAYDGAVPATGVAGLIVLGWPNQGLWLAQGYSLSSLTAALDAADQYDQIVAYVQELPSGPEYASLPVEITYVEPIDG